MAKSLLRTDKEIAGIYERHKLTVYRVCFALMKNSTDTEDIVQDNSLQLIKKGPVFESEEQRRGSFEPRAIYAKRLRHQA